MPPPFTRLVPRRALLLSAAAAATARPPAAADRLAALEHAHGGRLGVFAIDTATQRILAHRADERFLLCSTFKAALAACMLHRADIRLDRLDRRIAFGAADLLEYAPFARSRVTHGDATIDELCRAAVELSDNTAANLLLAQIGGPAGLTAYLRRLGDGVTRLDRREPSANRPDGDHDTTTPRAMAGLFRTLLSGAALSPSSRARLGTWLAGSTTGLARLRGGVPADWQVGDKTGTGDTQCNDVAMLTPPGRKPIFVAAYYQTPKPADANAETALSQVGSAIHQWSNQPYAH